MKINQTSCSVCILYIYLCIHTCIASYGNKPHPHVLFCAAQLNSPIYPRVFTHCMHECMQIHKIQFVQPCVSFCDKNMLHSVYVCMHTSMHTDTGVVGQFIWFNLVVQNLLPYCLQLFVIRIVLLLLLLLLLVHAFRIAQYLPDAVYTIEKWFRLYIVYVRESS